MLKTIKVVSTLSALVLLTACGGGGDGSSTPSTSAEGFWNGTTSTGYSGSIVILENGETWGYYSSGSYLYGALYGNTTTSGNTLSGSGADFNLPSRTVTSGSYNGTFTQNSSISLRTSQGATFTGTYGTTYLQPASLTALAGVYRGQALTGTTAPQTVSVTITSTGQVTVPSSLGCSAAGTASPRPTGKNIFNLTVTFTGTNCALGNGGTASGILYYDSSTKQILAMAMNSAKSDGFIALGAKP